MTQRLSLAGENRPSKLREVEVRHSNGNPQYNFYVDVLHQKNISWLVDWCATDSEKLESLHHRHHSLFILLVIKR